jgi:hypothetical protein
MILETPKGTEDGEDLDAINLRVLRELETRARLDATDASRTARAS